MCIRRKHCFVFPALNIQYLEHFGVDKIAYDLCSSLWYAAKFNDYTSKAKCTLNCVGQCYKNIERGSSKINTIQIFLVCRRYKVNL